MRILQFALFATIGVFLIGCTSQKKQETPPDISKLPVVVGMTYDEVEKLLGKPVSIDRGVNELRFDVDKLTTEELLGALSKFSGNDELDILKAKLIYATENTAIAKETTGTGIERWPGREVVENVGALIYVTWTYRNIKIDTAIVTLNKFTSVFDTLMQGIPYDYVINGEFHVDKETYDDISDVFYTLSGRLMGPREYRSYDAYPLNKAEIKGPEKMFSKKAIAGAAKRVIKMRRIPVINSSQFSVFKVYTIVFDASSGRVVSSGYHPVVVGKI